VTKKIIRNRFEKRLKRKFICRRCIPNDLQLLAPTFYPIYVYFIVFTRLIIWGKNSPPSAPSCPVLSMTIGWPISESIWC